MSQQNSNTNSNSNIPVSEIFWSLVEKADKKFSKIRNLAYYQRNRYDTYFYKVFKVYTQLWKFQQENRQKLVESGLKRWEIGEIASRIGQLYFGQYMRTSEASYLSESYIFYDAILTREYLKDGLFQDVNIANKQLRFIARFLMVCLILNRREKIEQLVSQLKVLLEECKRTFQATDFKEWKVVVQEIVRFLKADSTSMNSRPLRYSLVLDPHPDSLPSISSSSVKKKLKLRDAILSSYAHNEVKFSELTLDTFRMLQCLEWEPSGSFYQSSGYKINLDGAPTSSRSGYFPDIIDPSLPPNPRKTILYRPSATEFLAVLATVCEELPPDGVLLLYLSSPGSRCSSEKESGCLLLGPPVNEGSNCIYPSDLVPFTRRPIVLVIDSEQSEAFKVICGAEKGELVAMLLSPSVLLPICSADSSRNLSGSLFTLFLTAPLQAFCMVLGLASDDVELETFNMAEKVLCAALNDWGLALATSEILHPVWTQILCDPFLRRILLRFMFCRAVLTLFVPTYGKIEFVPSCVPCLPESILLTAVESQTTILQISSIFGATSSFVFSQEVSSAACHLPVASMDNGHSQ